MTVELAALAVAAAAAISIATSAGVAALWPALRALLSRLTPAAEGRVVLALAALPLFASALALLACFLPSLGLAADHCLQHGHHPHLCLTHLPHAGLTLAIAALASVLVARAAHAAFRLARGIWRSITTERALCEAATPDASGVRVLPTENPEAFVLGLIRPKLFVSRGLLSMSDEVREVVLAHERAHVQRRDPLRHLVASAVLGFHLPWLAGVLRRRLHTAAESAADARAADALGDSARVADVIVRLARVHRAHPVHGLGFAGGNIEARVHRLLGRRGRDGFRPSTVTLLAAATALGTLALAEPLHHAIETFLGLLG
jgi:Zn-dependent protease with chaperone function